MSRSDWQRYLDRPINFHGRLTKQPILIADSKGNYLKYHSDIIENFGYTVDFECRKGARFVDYYYWLRDNLQRKVHQYGRIVLYIYLGTCDLTHFIQSDPLTRRRRQNFIELRHNDDRIAVEYLRYQIDRYFHFVASFPTVSIVFLEIPPYSIQEWNKSRGHPDPKSFLSQDLILYERISLVNDYIKSVNQLTGVRSPRFNLDLRRTRQSRGSNHRRVSISYAGYKDGIHPDSLLARCWFKRIVVLIFTDCA